MADTAYGSAPNLAWLVEDRGIEPHIPVFDKSARRDDTFERSAFIFDHEDDSYTCPGGNRLRPSNRNFSTPRPRANADGFIRYRAGETEAGRIALDHADAIFATGDELLGTLREVGAVRQALRIGALATLSRNFQMAFLRPLLVRSDIEIILRSGSSGELLRALEAHNLDVALINQAPSRDALTPFVAHHLAEQTVSLVGTPERLAENTLGLADLIGTHPVILPTIDSGVRSGFDALVNRLCIRPQIAAEVEDMAMMRLLAREDVGLAVVPPIVVRDEIAAGTLVEADRLSGIAETFYAVTMDRRFPNPLLQPLLDPDQRRGATLLSDALGPD